VMEGASVFFFRFSIFLVFYLWYLRSLYILVLLAFCVWFRFFSTEPIDWLEEHLRNDLFCIEWDVRTMQRTPEYWVHHWNALLVEAVSEGCRLPPV